MTETLPPPPAPTVGFSLTDEQNLALAEIDAFLDRRAREFKLGGYAGTGKTTLVRYLLDNWLFDRNVGVCAFTGKACEVLRRKGVPANTIHSTIYESSDEAGLEWYLKGRLPFDLLIVDEASMIPGGLYRDLTSFRIPLLFVGDPGQLEPIGDDPNLMGSCDFVLETIHRQAEGSPIIQMADAVRKGAVPKLGFKSPQLVTTKWPLPNEAHLAMADQIICGTNAVRRAWNGVLRALHGHKSHLLVEEGERIIVLKNNRERGVFNGQQLRVVKVLGESAGTIRVHARDDLGRTFEGLRLWRGCFEGKAAPMRPSGDLIIADYGYVITCHKSQGSEWGKVVVIDPGPIGDWNMNRWRYTAITRAADALIYAL